MNLKLYYYLYYKKFCSTVVSKWAVLLLDILLVGISFFLVYITQPRFAIDNLNPNYFMGVITCLFIINIVFFHIMHTYVGILRYSSFIDISRIFISLTSGYGSFFLINLILYISGFPAISNSFLLIVYVLNLTLMSSSRILVKLLYETIKFNHNQCINVFIYGVKEEGINIAKAIKVSQNNNYRLCGFISDAPDMCGKMMMGNKIYANNAELLDILFVKNIEAVIISPSKLQNISDSELLDKFINRQIKLLSVPQFSEWRNIFSDTIELKQIQIEDLLGRAPIQVDIRKIAKHIEGKRIMVTGAAGSIGSEIVRQISSLNPFMLILVDQAETPLHDIRLELQDRWRNLHFVSIIADIANWSRMESIFREYMPHYVFHAAAYKHVPMMEDNVSEAIQTNVLGTKNLADLAVKYETEKFVLVSTDKAVNPTNIMGCSKRIAEIYVQSLAYKLKHEGDKSVKFITTRFGNVLGSNGSVIHRFKEQIQKGGPVTVTHPDIIRYFMTIPEACRLVLEAGSMGNGGEIYVFDMGIPVKIQDLAKRMIFLSGFKDIKIEFTGLRQGEKLYEELLNIKEHAQTTLHEKIMIAKVREYKFDEVKELVQKLIKTSFGYDSMTTVIVMKEIVPEFISKNSEYEILDKPEAEILKKVI